MHFGRKTNTLFSNTLKKLGISDSYLKRPMLKPDEMESEIYSRDRLKTVRHDDNSPDVRPHFPNSALPNREEVEQEEVMKNLSAVAIRWIELTAGLDKVNRSILARKYLNPEQRQALKDVDSQLGLELHLELPPSKLKRKFQGK